MKSTSCAAAAQRASRRVSPCCRDAAQARRAARGRTEAELDLGRSHRVAGNHHCDWQLGRLLELRLPRELLAQLVRDAVRQRGWQHGVAPVGRNASECRTMRQARALAGALNASVQARKPDAQISAVEQVCDEQAPIIHRGAREAASSRAAHGVARRAQNHACEQILVDAHIGAEDRIHNQLADRLIVALRSASGPSIV
jgi:hypothetical protein